MRALWLLSLALSSIQSVNAETSSNNTGDQLQAFTFGYTTSNLVLPVIYTCPSPLLMTALKPTNAGGPDPSAPYTLIAFVHEQLQDDSGQRYERLYARSMSVGDLGQDRTFSHPWAEGTQFIGCIWSANGVSGGCQDLTTVVPSPNLTAGAYASDDSQCRVRSVMGSWVTNQSKTLDVSVEGSSGLVAQNGWPASCSDLKFTPKNGTGPYTLVIAPAMHPPANISSAGSGTSDDSMNYTIRLTHGQAFMAGVFDSAGNSFAIGPLHAGASDQLGCLAVRTGKTAMGHHRSFGMGALAGGTVGGLIVGALGALLFAWVYAKRTSKRSRSDSQELLDPYAHPRPASYRIDSATSSHFGKTPIPGVYTDMTPPIGYDSSPAMLYDPALAHGPQPVPFDPRNNRQSYHSDFNPQWRDSSMLSLDRTTTSDGQRDSLQTTAASRGRPVSGESSTGPGRGKLGRLHAVGGPASPRERERSRHGEDDEEDEDEFDQGSRRRRNVYVVHSDGGGGDVHIRLPDGRANVIELPPNYQDDPRSPPLPAPSPALSGSTIPASSTPAPNTSAAQPRSPPPTSLRSVTSGDHKPDIPIPYLDLQPSDSRASVQSEMTPDELRARAEAALAEKSRPLSVASGGLVSPPVPPSLTPPILPVQRPAPTPSPERRQSSRMGPRVPSGSTGGPGSSLGPSGPRPPPKRSS